ETGMGEPAERVRRGGEEAAGSMPAAGARGAEPPRVAALRAALPLSLAAHLLARRGGRPDPGGVRAGARPDRLVRRSRALLDVAAFDCDQLLERYAQAAAARAGDVARRRSGCGPGPALRS